MILDAVGQFDRAYVTRLAKLKKVYMASNADRLADDIDWMPAVYKAGHNMGPKESAQAAVGEANAPEADADEVKAHALAAQNRGRPCFDAHNKNRHFAAFDQAATWRRATTLRAVRRSMVG
ncbi:hypothetical protein [Cupriavidus necator]